MRTILVLLLAALAVVAAGCGDDGDTTEAGGDTGGDGEVQVADVWSRATAPTATTAAVYLSMACGDGDALVGATVDSSVAGSVQLHDVMEADDSEKDGMDDMDGSDDSSGHEDMDDMDHGDMQGVQMVEVDRIDCPAGETVPLEPGGYHLMMEDLVEPLEDGETVDVTLDFEGRGTVEVTSEVRAA